MKTFIVALFFTLCAGFLHADEPLILSARTEVLPSTTVPVAERSQIEITILSNRNISISSFSVPTADEFQITGYSVPKPHKNEDKWEYKIDLQLMPLAAGEMQFPSLSVVYKTEEGKEALTQTPPIKFTAATSSNVPPTKEYLKDIKGPVTLSAWYIFWIVLLLLSLALFAAWMVSKRARPYAGTAMPQEPIRPPWETALEKLAKLEEAYKRSGDVKMFYTELSFIFREYISGYFFVDAVEKTTTEIFAGMRDKNIDRKICLETKDLLQDSDLVKFAKFIPSEKTLFEDLEKVKKFVGETHPQEKVPAGTIPPPENKTEDV